jgi:hypothetical protein
MEEEICLMDCCTTNSILRETKYFHTLTQRSRNILTITGCDAMIISSSRDTIMFSNGTQVMIEDALLYPDSTHTLISFRDIRKNGLHVCTHEDNKEEFLLITKGVFVLAFHHFFGLAFRRSKSWMTSKVRS